MRLFFLPALLFLASVVFGVDTGINGKEDFPYTMDRTNLFTGQCGRRLIGSRSIRHMYPLKGSPDRDVVPDDGVVPAIQSRIIGGSVSKLGEFPWQASISRVVDSSIGDSWVFFECGATIINEYWLVTAAHCLNKLKTSLTVIDVGDWSLLDDNDPGQQRFYVDKWIYHEQYNLHRSIFDYDIALIKIKPSAAGRGIQFNNYVQPVCLPDAEDKFYDDTMCVAAGWGRTNPVTESVNNLSSYLKKLDVPIVNQQECRQWYSTDKITVSDLILCAGDMRGGSGICKGDSGSGLFCKTAKGYTLAGVVSGGKPCALPNFPGLYTRVISFVSWIHSTIGQYNGK